MINSGKIKKIAKDYLFAEVAREVKKHPDCINLSIGDAILPLPQTITEAGVRAVSEMGRAQSMHGYSPAFGYGFLREALSAYYRSLGACILPDEIFISEGIKSEMYLFLSFLDRGVALLPDPVYPAYLDANLVVGNKVERISGKDFVPFPDYSVKADIIHLCSPNNPVGNAYGRRILKEWINYALYMGAVILYDVAYESFIQSDAPHSIFEIEGAELCAVEFGSFSKSAGFTGLRCGYTVLSRRSPLYENFKRFKSLSCNGVSYVTQRMAEASLTEGKKECEEIVNFYRENALILKKAIKSDVYGGMDAPYLWVNGPPNAFEKLLELGVAVTPGKGFGLEGERYVRISSFCSRSSANRAAEILNKFDFCDV